jgi:hypothetical protein
MLLIGLGHKAKQGKGEVANYLFNTYSDRLKIEIYSFATAIRREIHAEAHWRWVEHYGTERPFDGHEALRLMCKAYGVPFDEHPAIDKLNPWGKQRVLQQVYGRLRRDQDEDYFVKRAMPLVDASKADVVIFDDMRKENEFEAIKVRNGYTFKVSRLGWVSDVPPHESETALDNHPFDALIGARDGNLSMLLTLADAAFRSLLPPERLLVAQPSLR